MARSAAQKQARRARRLVTFTFPFFDLPIELQLLVFCKCDLTSVKRLLRLSSSIRILLRTYRETCLRQLLGQLPHPIPDLICASWVIEKLKDPGFRTIAPIASIGSSLPGKTSPWTAALLSRNDDIVSVVEELLRSQEKIDFAVKVCAQTFGATVESLVNPWTEATPIDHVSPAEHLRFSTSLWVLTLYYQLQIKFADFISYKEVPRTFAEMLPFWLVEQVASLEHLIISVGVDTSSRLYQSPRERKASQARFLRSSLLHTCLDLLDRGTGTHPKCARPSIWRIFRHAMNPSWPFTTHMTAMGGPTASTDSHVPYPTREYEDAYPTHSYGYGCYSWMLNISDSRIRPDQRKMFSSLGLFFWDHDRLAYTPSWTLLLAIPSEILERFENRREEL